MATENNRKPGAGQSPWRLGVVSYLNARPLICGLERESTVRLDFDVPSRLTARLLGGDFDAALVPVIDLLRHKSELQIVSNACIGCDGETLTVRIFSKVPPADIRCIHLDLDSHTSVILARLVWPALYGKDVSFVRLEDAATLEECESVLLIGDKVVGISPEEFRYQVDLGSAWKTWTGLPFVFAVWAADRNRDTRSLGEMLGAARDRGVRKAGQLAIEYGPGHGWPAALAQQYLERYLTFGLTDKHVEGMIRFFDRAAAGGLVPGAQELQATP